MLNRPAQQRKGVWGSAPEVMVRKTIVKHCYKYTLMTRGLPRAAMEWDSLAEIGKRTKLRSQLLEHAEIREIEGAVGMLGEVVDAESGEPEDALTDVMRDASGPER